MSAKRSTERLAAEKRTRRRLKRDVSGTDWDRLRRMKDREAYHGALRDPDNLPADATWLSAARMAEPSRKRAISIRLDPDIIDWFRSTGPRYQSRMNAVLRAFVEHNRSGRGKR